jgi:zinc resistance-associated protein
MKTIVAASVLATMMAAAPAFAQAPAPQPRAAQPGAAQPAPAAPAAGQEQGRRPQLSAEDRAAFLDARIAGLKAALKLNPDQEKLWPPVEAALRDAAALRAQRIQQRREMRNNPNPAPVDPVQRLRTASERLTETAAMMKKLADAGQPLYASLDAAQKRRADIIFSRGGMMARGAMMVRGGMMERGHHRGQQGQGRE